MDKEDMPFARRGRLLTLWSLPALDERIADVAGTAGAHRRVARDATVGVGAAVVRTRVLALLAHTGQVAETVGADHALRSTAGRGAQVHRQAGAGRTAVEVFADRVRAAWVWLARIGHDQLRFWKGAQSMLDSKQVGIQCK